MDAYTVNLLGALAIGCSDIQISAMGTIGLDLPELTALLIVHARPGSKVDDVARTTGFTHSGAVRVIDRLCDGEWVERRTGRDRRAVALHCTREGRRQAKRAIALRREALGNVMQEFTTNELVAFRRLARKFLAKLPRERTDAWRICRLCDHTNCAGSECPVGSAVP